MAIEKINSDLCNGCGKCEKCCPADVIRVDKENKKAFIAYPEECMLCLWCLCECPQNAITVSPIKTSPLFLSWG